MGIGDHKPNNSGLHRTELKFGRRSLEGSVKRDVGIDRGSLQLAGAYTMPWLFLMQFCGGFWILVRRAEINSRHNSSRHSAYYIGGRLLKHLRKIRRTAGQFGMGSLSFKGSREGEGEVNHRKHKLACRPLVAYRTIPSLDPGDIKFAKAGRQGGVTLSCKDLHLALERRLWLGIGIMAYGFWVRRFGAVYWWAQRRPEGNRRRSVRRICGRVDGGMRVLVMMSALVGIAVVTCSLRIRARSLHDPNDPELQEELDDSKRKYD